MSNTINNQIPLTQIIAPSLSDANYASGLNDVFDNINDNFSTLSNHDFIKGESGTSVKIQEDKFFNEDGSLTILGKKLQYCILSLSNNEDEYSDVNASETEKINIFDYFKANPGVLYMVYNTVNDVNTQTPVAISSLYYVFLDGRYATTKIGKIDESQYTSIKDFSCVLVYDANIKSIVDGKEVDGGFKALTTAFPTIYYESNVGLCWKVNGNGTGIPIQGVPGRNGLDTNLQIVKGEAPEKTESNQIVSNITSLYGLYDGFIEFDLEEDYSYLHGKAALILAPNEDTANDNSFYFGMLEVKGDVGEQVVRAYCDQSTSIDYSMANETMINVMKDINVVGGDIAHTTIPGLFIPMESRGDNNTQKVHLMAATSLTNTKGQTSDLKTDLMYTPISDINTFDISGADEENGYQLIVDKYLYVKINENTNFGIDNKKYSDEWLTNRRKFGGYLKYKLVNSISSIDSPYMGCFNSSESLENIGGSKIRTNVYYRTLLQRAINGDKEWDKHKYIFADEHNRFKNNGVDTANGSVPAIKSINCQIENDLQFKCSLTGTAYITESEEFPDENEGILQYVTGNEDIVEDKFLLPVSWFVDDNRTTLKSNIYRWVLCDQVDEFDIEELPDNYKYMENVDSFIKDGKYLFENEAFKNFAVILTNTMCPTYDSEILWYNSLNVLGIPVTDAMKVTPDRQYEDVAESILIVAGWQSNVMQFVKFVPVYRNSYAVDVDTAFNINYNVNITGDGNKSTKSLTVHGGINCDDLSVYKLTATGEIKNIFTQEDITGCAGILLGRYDKNEGKKDDDKNPLPPDYDYKFKVNNNGSINASSLNIDNVKSNKITTSELVVDDIDFVGEESITDHDVDDSRNDITYTSEQSLLTINRTKDISYQELDIDRKPEKTIETDYVNVDINNIGSINLSTQQGKNFRINDDDEEIVNYKAINTINSSVPVVMEDNAPIVLINNDTDKSFGNPLLELGKTWPEPFNTYNTFARVFNAQRSLLKNNTNNLFENISISFKKNPKYNTGNNRHGGCDVKELWQELYADNKNYMVSFEITKDHINKLKTGSEHITIRFDKAIDFQIGLNGENENGSHPYLELDSFIEPKIYANDALITNDVFPNGSRKYFGGVYLNSASYNEHGNWIQDNNPASWRFYTFVYHVPEIKIPVDKLKTISANNKNVTIKINFNIFIHVQATSGTWGRKSVIYDAILRSPIFSGTKNDASSRVYHDKNTHYINSTSDYTDRYKNIVSIPISSHYTIKKDTADIRAINISNDGIIITANNKLFGLSFTKPNTINVPNTAGDSELYMYFVKDDDLPEVLEVKQLLNLVNNANAYGL